MAANNSKLVIAIIIFIGLAIFGAAVFGGFLRGNDVVAPVEQTTGDASGTTDAVEEQAGTTETDATTDTAADATSTFDLESAKAIRGIGNEAAPIKIIEYASLTCHHCADFHTNTLAAVKEKYVDTGKVYLEFREFPLNAPALDASLLARCVSPDRYESFTGLLFKTQSEWMERPDYITVLKQNAKLTGLSESAADQCLASQELRQFIGAGIQNATEKYKVSSTPTFVFNDGADFLRGAMPIDEFDRVIAKLSGEAAPAEAAPVEPATETPAAETEEVPATPEDTTTAPEAQDAPEATAPVEEPVAQ